jgi:DNA-binding response OmpR family regulator
MFGGMRTLLIVGFPAEETSALGEAILARGYSIRAAAGCNQVLTYLLKGPCDAVLRKADLHDGDWRDVLDEMGLCPFPPTLIVAHAPSDDATRIDVSDLGGCVALPSPVDAATVVFLLESFDAARRHSGRERPEGQLAGGSA